ncbi:uncharacterized protein [Hyperolius riggenbachi]|uniref:uncharacterized protein isoform X2 n=1 Tax=Hyperolius riggenbachi TaxID=752182 RepID=UPI0035A2850A
MTLSVYVDVLITRIGGEPDIIGASSMFNPILIPGLVLLLFTISSGSTIKYKENSAEIKLCGIKCVSQLSYKLDYYSVPAVRVPMMDVICNKSYWKIHDESTSEVILDEPSGCCTIREVEKRGSGFYALSLGGIDGKLTLKTGDKNNTIDPMTECYVVYSSPKLEEVTSLTVTYQGDQSVSNIWGKDDRDLFEGHQLSDNNEILIFPHKVNGALRVAISNTGGSPRSNSSKTITEPANHGLNIYLYIFLPMGGLMALLIGLNVWLQRRSPQSTHYNVFRIPGTSLAL